MPERRNIYREQWDRYVQRQEDAGDEGWPGDEWGTPERWDQLFARLFEAFGVEAWERVVEVGPGSGKYSLKILDASPARLLLADVSPAFLEVCRRRLEGADLAERTSFLVLDEAPRTLYERLDEEGWVGRLDALVSMDAMVHVDLQYLVCYLVTAAAALAPGGKLVLTLANSCSEGGFRKLIRDVPRIFPRQGMPSGKFEWLSPQATRDVLERLGFRVLLLEDVGRDILVVASRDQPPAAWILEEALGIS